MMVLQLRDSRLAVEDARNHPAEAVKNLRALLNAGAVALPDPHRKNFYEVQNGSKVYYIHHSPLTGRVLLLGIWPKAAERPAGNGKGEEGYSSAAD